MTLTQVGGRIVGTDGRHRIAVARERGEKTIEGVLRVLGSRGGERRKKITIEI